MKKESFLFIAKFISSKIGITFQESDRWSANAVKKIIKYPSNIDYSEDALGYIIHEASHLKFTDLDMRYIDKFEAQIKSKKKSFKEVFGLINALEDIRINYKICGMYKGAKMFLSTTQTLDLSETLNNIETSKGLFPDKYEEMMSNKMLLFSTSCMMSGLFIEKELAEDLLLEMPNDVLEAREQCELFLQDVIKAGSTLEILEIVRDKYLPICYKFLSDLNKEEDEDEDEDKKDKKDKEKKEQDFKKFLEALKKMLEKFKDFIKEEQARGEVLSEEQEIENEKAESLEKKSLLSCEKKAMGYEEFEKMFRRKTRGSMTFDLLNTFISQNISKMNKSISILKEDEYTRYQTGFESGHLDQRRIKKIFTGSTRIFERRIEKKKDNQDMVIAVLVDESGSMARQKAEYACKAVGLLAKSLEMSRKSFGVFGFNKYYFIHKDFNKKLNLNEIVMVDSNVFSEGACDNNDGYAVWKTAKALSKRPEKNKIMIVFSDGQPANGSGTGEDGRRYYDYDLKTEVSKAERSGIKIYSFGILDESVKEYYTNYKIINDPKNLPNEMIKIIKENTNKR